MTRLVPLRTKTLRGTARADRIKPKVDPSARLVDVPEAPALLSPGAAAEWRTLARTLVDLGTLTAADLRALEMLAGLLNDIRMFGTAIAADGLVITSGGVTKAHPGLAALGTARGLARMMLRDFGLTPGARVEAAPMASPQSDPLDEFTVAGR